MSGIVNKVGSKSGIIGTTELDYEEGVFTVGMSGNDDSAAGMHSGYEKFAYTKVGRMITFLGQIVVNGAAPTGISVKVTGFPFSNSNNGGTSRSAINIGSYAEFSLDAAGYSLTGGMFEAGDFIYIYEYSTTSGTHGLDGADWGTGQASFCGTYFID